MFASEYATSMALTTPCSLLPGAIWMAWLAEMLNIHIVLVVPVLLLFPNGHLPGRRWASVLWLVALSAGVAEAFLAVRSGPLGSAPAIANPLDIAAVETALQLPYRASMTGSLPLLFWPRPVSGCGSVEPEVTNASN